MRRPRQAIACYDLGEFARIHPKGKSILEVRTSAQRRATTALRAAAQSAPQETGAKVVLLSLMSAKNADVQKEALFAVQKLM